MLIFLSRELTFLATPKTGTTAVEMALKPAAEIVFSRNRKHLTALRYKKRVLPFLQDTFSASPEPLAVMRDPIEQIRSWYRYRSQPRLDGKALSTKGLTFEQFALEVISDAPPPRAQIGSQFSFLTSGQGDLLVQHLFAYESQPAFRDFLADRLGREIKLKPKNVSPDVPAPLSSEVEARLRAARAKEFALYDRLMAAEGYLHTPQE
ncbi:hypothetical protein DSM14862_02440 [Sulfitobacter indolifex]|uniref:Gamma-glutamyl kinase n=1 Tax=Sulfitobacter indolifex HEL-45 TaxID=391624 RepID=A0ABM9X7J1_9RHOB|nr:hypothetical protein [Sulfitobacter indolifex]EDQ05452.1 hypothetical protein OIHEL45_01540 [Sulfitobacter indolifex HEL-45]UOA19630.1 hypothetical protein DSM14862_02440 [Sulfitobacter indolifex]